MINIDNVGIDFTSLVDDNQTISGTCIIYSSEDDDEFEDYCPFTFDLETNDLSVDSPEVFEENKSEIEEQLLENILTNVIK